MHKEKATIGNTLFSKTQQQVLGLLYGQPDRSFYTKEIVRSAGVGIGTVQRELSRLLEAGLVTAVQRGNQKHYQANPDCPVYQELRGLVLKTFGIAGVLTAALAPYRDHIQAAFIYGSIAKREDTARSDIDLMVIGVELTYATLMDGLAKVEGQLGRPINPSVYSPTELRQKVKEGNAFLKRVMQQQKIMLMGDMDDIGELAKPGKD